MEKVLVSNDEGDIHYISKPFGGADYSLCGVRLHPIWTTRVNEKHAVSCPKCIKLGACWETPTRVSTAHS